jgi:hypothetical protein
MSMAGVIGAERGEGPQAECRPPRQFMNGATGP